MRKLILVSGSPRRRELMQQMELDFIVDKDTSFEEIVPDGMKAEDVPEYFAKGKAALFHRPLEADEVLVSADTIVLCDGKIMGKPKDKQQAFQMLKELSGRTHQVITAVSVRNAEKQLTRTDVADVQFRKMDEAEIQHYLDAYSPLDKAGAYGIQEWIGLVAVESIKGSFYTIMGLPTHLLYALLQKF